jgi:hypothetical protein
MLKLKSKFQLSLHLAMFGRKGTHFAHALYMYFELRVQLSVGTT